MNQIEKLSQKVWNTIFIFNSTEKLADEKENASNLKWRHQELSETSSSEKHFKTILHQQLKEKQDIIAQ